jgi:hypothetical protein
MRPSACVCCGVVCLRVKVASAMNEKGRRLTLQLDTGTSAASSAAHAIACPSPCCHTRADAPPLINPPAHDDAHRCRLAKGRPTAHHDDHRTLRDHTHQRGRQCLAQSAARQTETHRDQLRQVQVAQAEMSQGSRGGELSLLPGAQH